MPNRSAQTINLSKTGGDRHPCSHSHPHPRLLGVEEVGGVDQVVVFADGKCQHFVEQLLLARTNLALHRSVSFRLLPAEEFIDAAFKIGVGRFLQ